MSIWQVYEVLHRGDRPEVKPAPGIRGEPVPAYFRELCEKRRLDPLSVWSIYRARCTGEVPWNLPSRGISLGDIPLLGPAVNLAAGLVPGGQYVASALGFGAQTMSNGWDPWIGVGQYGVGWCPPPNKCIGGVSAAGVCLGTCVPATAAEPSLPYITQPLQPQQPQVPAVYEGGAVATTKICCPSGYHPNRSAYFTRGIRDGGGPRWVPKGSKCVRNRRTNPLNPSALSRAGSRLYQGKQANKWLQKVQVPKRRR